MASCRSGGDCPTNAVRSFAAWQEDSPSRTPGNIPFFRPQPGRKTHDAPGWAGTGRIGSYTPAGCKINFRVFRTRQTQEENSQRYDKPWFFYSFKTAIRSSPSISPVSTNPNERYSRPAASFSGSYDSQQYSASPHGNVLINSRASLTASFPYPLF